MLLRELAQMKLSSHWNTTARNSQYDSHFILIHKLTGVIPARSLSNVLLLTQEVQGHYKANI
jgi:hypothetical protein